MEYLGFCSAMWGELCYAWVQITDIGYAGEQVFGLS
jgi:hypothetical protein